MEQERLAPVYRFPDRQVEQIGGQAVALACLTELELKALEQDARDRMEEARCDLMIVAEYRTAHFPQGGAS